MAAIVFSLAEEFVAGAVGAVWKPQGGLVRLADAEAWRSASIGGTIKAAIDSALAADDRARRLFRADWLGIGPFSALIRRRWPRAAAECAALTR